MRNHGLPPDPVTSLPDPQSYIWDMNNPTTPRETLTPASQLCCINYSPKNENWLGAGQYNGQLVWFDVSQGGRPVGMSPIMDFIASSCFSF